MIHVMPTHLVSRKRWGEMVTMEVSASVDMCQPDGLATSDRGSPLTHCGCLPPYPPVTIAVIHRGYTCHWLLPTTCNRKKKKKKCELNQTSLFPLANLVPYVIKQAWRSGDETLCCFFFFFNIKIYMRNTKYIYIVLVIVWSYIYECTISENSMNLHQKGTK